LLVAKRRSQRDWQDARIVSKKGGLNVREFKVLRREVHVAEVKVIAEDPTEAIQRVANGEGNECSAVEYSENMPTNTWSVEIPVGNRIDTYYHNPTNDRFDRKNDPSKR
jgi:hypothetical protein